MIKALGRTGDGRLLLLLGLSGENVARLAADEPIRFPLEVITQGDAEIFPKADVVIVYGTTEAAILQQLVDHGLLTPDAVLNLPPGIG